MDTESPKGEPREIFVSMMYNVLNFSKKLGLDLEGIGATLSIFYLTHIYATSKFDLSPDKIFAYFKELLICHTLPFPPDKKKIYTHKETKSILEFFYRIYVRNLPLLRMLCLPNFAFIAQYNEHEMKSQEGDDVKGDEKPEKKSGKKSKKEEKKSKSKSPDKKQKKKKKK